MKRGMERGYADAHLVQLAVECGHLRVYDTDDSIAPPDLASSTLGAGERETVGLALREGADLALLDDLDARVAAEARGLAVKGTLGVIVDAYRSGILRREEARALIEDITARADIWISGDLCQHVLAALT